MINRELLLAEKAMLEAEPIQQCGKYAHFQHQAYIDTEYGALRRRYIALRISEIENILKD